MTIGDAAASRSWDVVIVGGGSAGSVLAARLSEDPHRTVLLLEAGAAPTAADGFPAELLDAGLVAGARPGQAASWQLPARLTPSRDYEVVRGRILGGSSTTNGGYFIRPRMSDLASWAALGGEAWSYERALPLMRRSERDLQFGGSPLHGDAGPIAVGRAPLDDAATSAFVAAASALGLPFEPDKNAQDAEGVGPVPSNALDGVKQNAALAYLLPVLDRPNLRVLGGALVTRVVIEGGRAVGVEYTVEGPGSRSGSPSSHRVLAGEVVLSAGALRSPQLLMLAGIGPADALRAHGIEVVVDAPAVGAGFSDHPQLVVDWMPRHPIDAPPHAWMPAALHHDGIEVLPSVKPMAELLGGGVTGPAAEQRADARDAPEHGPALQPLPLLVSVQTPRPVGRLTLASADPRVPPRLDYRYLLADADRARARDAVRLGLSLLDTAPWRAVAASVIGPLADPDVQADDSALDAWIAATLGTALHTCGTVPFGGEDAPVDGAGRVRGVEGLRIADTSILPTAPVRGPAASAILVGELVADAMRG